MKLSGMPWPTPNFVYIHELPNDKADSLPSSKEQEESLTPKLL